MQRDVLSSPVGLCSSWARTTNRVALPWESWMLSASISALYIEAARLFAMAAEFADSGLSTCSTADAVLNDATCVAFG